MCLIQRKKKSISAPSQHHSAVVCVSLAAGSSFFNWPSFTLCCSSTGPTRLCCRSSHLLRSAVLFRGSHSQSAAPSHSVWCIFSSHTSSLQVLLGIHRSPLWCSSGPHVYQLQPQPPSIPTVTMTPLHCISKLTFISKTSKCTVLSVVLLPDPVLVLIQVI